MPLPLIAAGISTVGGLIKGAQDRSFSREMYQRQYDDNLTNWNRQNEYNSPKNQAARLEQAGLNKALMYGQGSNAAAGNASGTSQGASPQAVNHVDPLTLGLQHLSTFQDLKIKQAQEDNIKADSTNKRTQLFNIESDTTLKNATTQNKTAEFSNLRAMLDKIKAETSATTANERRTNQDTKFLQSKNYHQNQINKLYEFGGITRDPIMQKLLGAITNKLFK